MNDINISPLALNRFFRTIQWEGLDLPWHVEGGVRRIELGLRAWKWEYEETRRVNTGAAVVNELSAA